MILNHKGRKTLLLQAPFLLCPKAQTLLFDLTTQSLPSGQTVTTTPRQLVNHPQHAWNATFLQIWLVNSNQIHPSLPSPAALCSLCYALKT